MSPPQRNSYQVGHGAVSCPTSCPTCVNSRCWGQNPLADGPKTCPSTAKLHKWGTTRRAPLGAPVTLQKYGNDFGRNSGVELVLETCSTNVRFPRPRAH